jgi:hypothetical protein
MNSLESKKIWVAVVLAALVALPTFAQQEATPTVAAVEAGPGSISWEPRVSFDKLVLTVEGGGYHTTQEFTGRPYFAAVDPEGYQLPDGSYTWELTVVPRTRPASRGAAEESADGRSTQAGEASEALVQSGSFTIVNGAIVAPGPAAARPGTRAATSDDVDDSDEANP